MTDVVLPANPGGYDVPYGTDVRFYATSRGAKADGTPATIQDYQTAFVRAGFGSDIWLQFASTPVPGDWPSENVPAPSPEETVLRGRGTWQGKGSMSGSLSVGTGPTVTIWQAWQHTDNVAPTPTPTPSPTPEPVAPSPIVASNDVALTATKSGAYHPTVGGVYRINMLVPPTVTSVDVVPAMTKAGWNPLAVWGASDVSSMPADWPMGVTSLVEGQSPFYMIAAWRGPGAFKKVTIDAARPLLVTGVWQHGSTPKPSPRPWPSPNPRPMPLPEDAPADSGGNSAAPVAILGALLLGARVFKRG